MGVVAANAKGYNFRYADLAEIVRYAEDTMHVRLRWVTVFREQMPNTVFQATEILDAAGKKLEGPLCEQPVMPVEKKGMDRQQAWGSAVTYARRYSAMGALGLASTEDEEQLSAGLQRDMHMLSDDTELKKEVDLILSKCRVPKGMESQFISQRLGVRVSYRELSEQDAQRFVESYGVPKK